MYICMQNHKNDPIKTSDTVLLEKYTSHFIESVVCERELEAEQSCNILALTLMPVTAFLSRFPGLLNRGPSLCGHVPHSSIFSPTATAQSRVLKALSAWSWFSLLHLISIWLTSCVHPGYIFVRCPPSSCRRHKFALNLTRLWSRLYLDIPRPDAPVTYTGAFSILTAWPGLIYYSMCEIQIVSIRIRTRIAMFIYNIM